MEGKFGKYEAEIGQFNDTVSDIHLVLASESHYKEVAGLNKLFYVVDILFINIYKTSDAKVMAAPSTKVKAVLY